jgi:hypothetical protein
MFTLFLCAANFVFSDNPPYVLVWHLATTLQVAS